MEAAVVAVCTSYVQGVYDGDHRTRRQRVFYLSSIWGDTREVAATICNAVYSKQAAKVRMQRIVITKLGSIMRSTYLYIYCLKRMKKLPPDNYGCES